MVRDVHAVLAQEAQARARSGSVVSMPPSPVVITLRGWKEKQASAQRADGRPCSRADRAGGVLDDRHAGGSRARGRVHVGGHADLVHQHDRPRRVRWRDRAFRRRSRLQVPGSTSAKTGVGAALPDRVGGGDERERRHDDLVAGADARAASSARCSAVVQVDTATRVRRADGLGERRLELATRGPWATQPDATASATAALLLAERRRHDGDRGSTHQRTAQPASRCRRSRARSARHQCDELAQAVLEVRPRRLEAEVALARRG